MVTTLAALAPRRDRCISVVDALAHGLPDGGLQRGRVVGCAGPAAMSLGLALAAKPVMGGAWLAVVGVPMFGIEAAAEFGVPLSRVVIVAAAGAADWAERVAAAADGFDVVLTCPPPGAERVVRKVRNRLQARGVVMIAVGSRSPGVSCDLELTTSAVSWAGIGRGWGHLTGRRARVSVGGRRVPRPVELDLWLPGPNGQVVLVDERAVEHDLQLSRAG